MRRMRLSQILLAGFLLFAAMAQAASIRSFSVHELSQNAETIFEGRVIGHSVEGSPDGRMIRTRVTFEVVDLIKGEPGIRTLRLSFAGGEIGGRGLIVSDQLIPAPGEQGIYFIEDASRQLINPILGWDQGHFLVLRDKLNRQALVTTRRGEAVYGIEQREQISAPQALSEGVARGIVTTPFPGAKAPVSATGFKQAIRGMIR